MKSIDIKSLLIGALLTSTIFLGIAATGPLANGKVKLDGPVDVRLSFGSSKATASNTSTPTELDSLDILNINLQAAPALSVDVGGKLNLAGRVATD